MSSFNLKITNVDKYEGIGSQLSYTDYTLKSDDHDPFIFREWSNGQCRVLTYDGRSKAYSSDFFKAMLEAIHLYKLKKSLTPKTQQTFKELIDEL
jgi:hypothetical protein